MSPTKRRMIASDVPDEDEDSFKHRRSSLRVNLSYCTNLSDSGNGSLGPQKDERKMDKSQTNRRLSSSKRLSVGSDKVSGATNEKSKYAENDDSKLSLQIKKGIQLKRLTINLEDISAKEQALDINCKRLKDAILSKTKEIFNKQDELSVRTAMVLANQEDCSVSNILIANKESITCNQYIDTANNQQKEYEYSNINATPKNGEKRRNSEKAINKSKLTPKRLFTKNNKRQECRIIEDIILDKSFPLFFYKQVDQGDSPVLSGSSRRLQLLRSRSKLLSQNQSKDHNNTHLTAYSDHSIGQPITCSTFIEDNVKDKEERDKNFHDEANQQDDINASQCIRTINTLVSMEMTEIHGAIQSNRKHSFLPSRDSCISNINVEKKECNNKSIEQNKSIKSAQRLENISNPLNKFTLQNSNTLSVVTNQNVITACANTAAASTQSVSIEEITLTTETCDVLHVQEQDNQIMKQSKKRCTLSPSDSDSIRSSLNVNTSLDVVTGTNKEKNVKISDDCRIIVTNRCLESTTNKKGSVLDSQRESINANHTSLQVNTSVGSTCKTWRRKSNYLNEQSLIENENNKPLINHSNIDSRNSSTAEVTKTNDVDFLENISLIERLRNISTQNHPSHNEKLEIPETGNVGSNNVISANFQSANNNSRDSHSYVEGTPYPISRSVLFKRKLKNKTQNLANTMASCSSNSTSSNSEENNSRAKSNDLNPTSISNKMNMSTETSRKIEDDVIVEDTLNCNPFIIPKKTTVIEDTLGKAELETNEKNTVAVQNAKHVSTRKGKKRLMPLHDSSQLCSIELLEKHSDTSEQSMTIKRNKKKLKKKRSKKKAEDSKNNASIIKNNITSKQVSLDDDCDISDNTKKENKKMKKPRKIVSKKIFIKKFADENIVNIMEESKRNKEGLLIESRDSSNDFVMHRMIPTQWNKYKSQKIVIVTTGLSKGDKSLVKSIVISLGMAEIELNVSRRTTHVVSTGVRTVNLLRAIIRGCWLITLEWVLKSLESNMWLNPEEFEMKHFSKAVLENRKDRQLFGPSYIPELFTACGFIYVEHKTTLPCDTLKELIKTAGGHITENPKLARIIVGANGVKETWVIDSITTGELQSTQLYQRK